MKYLELLKKIDIKAALMHNFWLKIVSLIMAGVIWLYVSGEITKGIRI